MIDWETTTTGSPLVDIGSLFRYSKRYDRAFCDAFARGYRDAGGELPEDWLLTSRLLDATWLVDMLDDEQEHPHVFADCVRLVANLVADVDALERQCSGCVGGTWLVPCSRVPVSVSVGATRRGREAEGRSRHGRDHGVIEDQFTGFRESTRTSTIYAKDAMLSMTGGVSTPQVNRASDAEGKWTIFGPPRSASTRSATSASSSHAMGSSAWASFIAKVNVDGLSKSGRGRLPRDRAVREERRPLAGPRRRVVDRRRPPRDRQGREGRASSATLETVFDQDLGDRDVLAAARALATTGLDATASARKDVVGIGIGPGERASAESSSRRSSPRDWGGKLSLDGSILGRHGRNHGVRDGQRHASARWRHDSGARVRGVREGRHDMGALVHVAAAPPV